MFTLALGYESRNDHSGDYRRQNQYSILSMDINGMIREQLHANREFVDNEIFKTGKFASYSQLKSYREIVNAEIAEMERNAVSSNGEQALVNDSAANNPVAIEGMSFHEYRQMVDAEMERMGIMPADKYNGQYAQTVVPMVTDAVDSTGIDNVAMQSGSMFADSVNSGIMGKKNAGDSDFENLSDDLVERSAQVDRILDAYSSRKSKWSGRTIIKPREEMSGVLGRKEWACDITLRADAGVKTVIHEHLHARSISHYDKETYMRWKVIEEATVEFYAQEICKKNRMEYKESYKDEVKNLRIINSILKIYKSDFEFAQALFETDLNYRFEWLEKISSYVIEKGVLSSKTAQALNVALNKFKRR